MVLVSGGSEGVPATEEHQLATIPEDVHLAAGGSIAVGIGVDNQRVSNEEDTQVQGVGNPSADWAVQLGYTENTIDVSSRLPLIDVAIVGIDIMPTVPGPADTPTDTRPLTETLTEGEDQQRRSLEAFWSLLEEPGNELW